jgi:hypothetical protein
MNIISESVLNRTNEQVNTSLGQIRIFETDSALTIEHHVTERERLYSEYSNFAVKTAQSTVEMCRVVFEAKNGLSRTEYSEFLSDIGHKSETSTIRKYLAIGAQYDKLIQYTKLLPNSWTSIYTITQLASDTFDALAATDTDMSKMSGKEIKTLLEINKPKATVSSSSVSTNISSISNQTATSNFDENLSDEHCESSEVEVEVHNISEELVSNFSTYNDLIDVISTDDTYQVLVRFKTKPSNDSWWDLTEAIDAVIEERKLNVEVTETRPLFEVEI